MAPLHGNDTVDRLGAQGGGMRQSRLMSGIEAAANVMVGYGVAVATQLLVFPASGCTRR